MNDTTRNLIYANLMFLLYSFTSVFSKLAALEGKISVRFLMLYGGTIIIMAVYALCWQQIIKKLPLMVAYANKAVIVIWGMLWGILFFGEKVSAGKLIGILFVSIGVVMFAKSSNEGEA